MSVQSRLHVALDGFNLALPRGTGVATYARTLSYALKEMSCEVDVLYGLNIPSKAPSLLREILFFDQVCAEEPSRRARFLGARWKERARAELLGHRAVSVPVDQHVDARSFSKRLPAFDSILNARDLFITAWAHYRRTRRFLKITLPNTPDVMHWTYPLPIRARNTKNVYTIHDLVPLRLPHTTLDNKTNHLRLITDIVRHADAICTVSEASRRDIIDFAPQAAAITHNTYQSVREQTAVQNLSADIITQTLNRLYDLRTDGYFLYYGSIEPKKNIARLIEAFLASESQRQLVVVGAMAWKSEGEQQLLERGKRLGRIIQMEYLPENDLMMLIRGARAVLFPSLTEGFGLPVVEAMMMGTPVLTSGEASLPEVVGEAGLMVDAYDTISIMEGIQKLDRDDNLCQKMHRDGPVQARKFNMENYQVALKKFYNAVLG
ncbi:MAG: glycosyltransferase family 1 protein [Gluconobacter potus]|uniref:Glycosyltransferase family 4 protein n=1 Tax=Gluconobacter potus TaxID=2724927 RepID=A0ABR9YR91_9PROT|nr:glycosyltransferase family 4 protein [Gluconobacter sp. R71656]MBF0869187.1 glycosyltransferase family 4 protein [Gluconobacter sp. R75628]MBF0875184.1 glycosyltransferase family 4 protein [Gluconobacter sp. R75629]MBF0884154.1 glycosyltransferase family 4 protein [Gluconobacter potus]